MERIQLRPGMTVTRRSDILTTDRVDRNGKRLARSITGTVIYVHPKGRFHTVEYTAMNGRAIRESFWGVAP